MAGSLSPDLEKVLEFQPTKLTDLIPQSLLELFQFGFAEKADFPLTIVEKRGDEFVRIPEIDITHKYRKYCAYLRDKPEGDIFCKQCDERHASKMIDGNITEPEWFICDGGLVDFVIPIVVNKKTLAVFFGGQDRLAGTEEDLKKKAKNLSQKFSHVTEVKLVVLAMTLAPKSPKDIEEKIKIAQEKITNPIQSAAEDYFKLKLLHKDILLGVKVSDCFPSKVDLSLHDFSESVGNALEMVKKYLNLQFCAIFLCSGLNKSDQFTLVSSYPRQPSDSEVLPFPFQTVHRLFDETGKVLIVNINNYPSLKNAISRLIHLKNPNVIYYSSNLFGNSRCLLVGGFESAFQEEPPHKDVLLNTAHEIVFHANRAIFNESRLGFLRETGHLLRGPMQAIVGEAEYLNRRIDLLTSVQIKDSSDKILNAVDSLRKQVESFSLFSTGDVQESEYRFRLHPYVLLVRKIIDQFLDAARSRGIFIDLYTEFKEDERIPFAWEKMEILLTNVIDNAVKYSYSNRFVKVIITQDKNHYKTTIKNEGVGFEPDEVESIFEKYYRTRRKDPKRYIAGTGIGLSVAREIARKHGGDIQIQCKDIYRGSDNLFLWSEITTIITIRNDLKETVDG